jgi:hypothetical protein
MRKRHPVPLASYIVESFVFGFWAFLHTPKWVIFFIVFVTDLDPISHPTAVTPIFPGANVDRSLFLAHGESVEVELLRSLEEDVDKSAMKKPVLAR